MKRKFLLISLLTLLVTINANSQVKRHDFMQQSMSTNKTGMFVLGGWALTNMAIGGVGWAKTSGDTKYFHQMNFFWNTINLGIAGFSFYSMGQMTPMRMSPQEIMDMHIRFENLYLINAGLDIAYIGTGFLLRYLSQKRVNRADQLLGYGNSVILQGGFLFAFDGIMYLIQHAARINYLGDFKLAALPGGFGISTSFYF